MTGNQERDELFDQKEPTGYATILVDNSKISENDYNHTVRSYVEKMAGKINVLRVTIESTVAELKGGKNE
ncbi:MAG: hypothetical protein KAG98_02430 [Lentisphaeria bacterium]|nr:hypothetical protein [Lentisphaeria bacterium]